MWCSARWAVAISVCLGCCSALAEAPPSPAPEARPPARFIAPRAGKVVSSPAGCELAADADRATGLWTVKNPTPAEPGICAFDVGKGPTRLLLSWQSSGNPSYEETMYGGPGRYRIETSVDSTNGKNGSWKIAVTIDDNLVMNRAHAVDFAGQRWLRFVLTGKSPHTYEHGVQLDALQVHDISQGARDTWVFVGDSITAELYRGGGVAPSLATLINKRSPAHTPVVLTAGSGFFKAETILERLPKWMALNADVMTWCIGIGSNDNPNDPIGYRMNLESIVKTLQAAGKTVMIARIPWQKQSDVKWLNAEIDTVTEKYGLTRGPDFHSYFKAHPDHLRDGLHPTIEGAREMHRLWAEAVKGLYPAGELRPTK